MHAGCYNKNKITANKGVLKEEFRFDLRKFFLIFDLLNIVMIP